MYYEKTQKKIISRQHAHSTQTRERENKYANMYKVQNSKATNRIPDKYNMHKRTWDHLQTMHEYIN